MYNIQIIQITVYAPKYNLNSQYNMADLEALTKTLLQVVGTLQDLISKKGAAQSSLEPQPKLKKTSDMTYNQFIKQVLSSKKPIQISSKKSSFHLQEDMQLLYELSHHTPINTKTFDAIAAEKKINRTADALKTRYNQFLVKIDENQMKKIVNWIQNEDLEGYLFFDGEQMKIQHRDPKESEKKRARPAGIETQSKKVSKASKLKNIPSNCKELSEVLKLYSKMVNYPIRTLVEKLDLVSGDLVQLDNYIETKDARILWTPEEDQILRKGSQTELQVLRRYRGAAVETRKKYLGI